jgi:hypothetical protein
MGTERRANSLQILEGISKDGSMFFWVVMSLQDSSFVSLSLMITGESVSA